MARADWGASSGDLSGTFRSLIDYIESRAQSATQSAVNQSKAEQSAQDSDTYDQWQNGLIDDKTWLAYIKQRLDATASDVDPKDHQQWVETYRQMSTKIADDSAESAYKSGDITLNQLVAHYQDRLSGLKKNSDEFRNVQSHYWDLVDKRDGQIINDKSMALVAKIERGQASYSQLLAFYQDMLKNVRSSSPLVEQIKQQIQNIKDVVDGVSGGSGGGGGGGGGGSASSKAAAEATKYMSQANSAVVKMYRTGNVFVPGGPNVVQSTFDLFNVKDTTTQIMYALEADNRTIEDMMGRWGDSPDVPFLTDPRTGEQINNTAENRSYIHNQAIRTYDYRAALSDAAGKYAQAAGIRAAEYGYITKTMQKDNSIAAKDFIQTAQQAWFERVTAATNNPDPTAALEDIITASKDYGDTAAAILGERTVKTHGVTKGTEDTGAPTTVKLPSQLFTEQQVDQETRDGLKYAEEFTALLADKTITADEKYTALSKLVDSRPTNFWLTSDELKGLIGNRAGKTDPPTGFLGVMDASNGVTLSLMQQSNPAAAVQMQIDSGGTAVPYTYVSLSDGSIKALPDSQVSAALGLDTPDFRTSGQAKPIFESVGGRVVAVWHAPHVIDTPKAWQDKNNKWVTDQTVRDKVGTNDPQAIADAGYHQEAIPELANWASLTDSAGRVWYVDPADGHMTLTPPFTTGATPGLSSLVIKDGKLNLERHQFSADGEYIAGVGPGVSMREAQDAADAAIQSGSIDLNQYHSRDANNNVSFDPLDPSKVYTQYWTPADQSMLEYSNFETNRAAALTDQQRLDQQTSLLHQKTLLMRHVAQQDYLDQTMSKQQQLQFQKMNPDVNPYDYAQGQLQKTAQSLGLTIGRNIPKGVDITGGAPPVMQPSKAPTVAPVTLNDVLPPGITRSSSPSPIPQPVDNPFTRTLTNKPKSTGFQEGY